MQTKPKGSVHPGSVIHHILSELERYPDSWFQHHHFPDLDASTPTIARSFWRLIQQEKVEHRLVLSDNPEQRSRTVIEIKWIREPADA
jgi:hypothetical protein